MRKYPIPELASVLAGYVKGLKSRPSVRPLKVYPPFWPTARGTSGFANQPIQDIEEAEDWEELLILTPQDRREYRAWIKSLL